jgi:hypothetical protein
MKPRFRKAIEIPHMVIMQVEENHVFNRIRVDAERREPLHGTAKECALASFRYFCVEPGIDDERSAATLGHPNEVIHRHRPVMKCALRRASWIVSGSECGSPDVKLREASLSWGEAASVFGSP